MPEEKPSEEEAKPVEEAPEEMPTPIEEGEVAEEKPKIPNVFVHEPAPHTGSLTGPRLLVVVDEGKGYPMDDAADRWVREHNIPILGEMPEGVEVAGAERCANLVELAKKLEA